ncbi:hypothetical protein PMG71_11130 [Roseofilum sp. BLCC_M154]|uniref:vWA-MoxR associated protein N-terminal HTH domain-containing protein n=1 Tax=Roseofilum acuticapitatum BLCC-M154 TaxID=3022444 RepID=A0ABT7ASU6_9CYAN|nr:hypothetical protein [Roseofilum acuticapitatum]MDJ1169980.1 hypothetical protein [Roseofilum acuticapitatum BLCC-M154]
MNTKQLLRVADTQLYRQTQKHLTDIERQVLTASLAGISYKKMSKEIPRSQEQLKRVGARLWKKLSLVFGEEIQKNNIRGTLERYLDDQESEDSS